MISRLNRDVGAHSEPRRNPNSAETQMASGQVANVEARRPSRLERITTMPAPKFIGTADARELEAYVERRRRLAERIRSENPSHTEEEIEARLEQFGA